MGAPSEGKHGQGVPAQRKARPRRHDNVPGYGFGLSRPASVVLTGFWSQLPLPGGSAARQRDGDTWRPQRRAVTRPRPSEAGVVAYAPSPSATAPRPPPDQHTSERRTDTTTRRATWDLEWEGKASTAPKPPATQGPRQRLGTNGTTPGSGAGGDAFAEDFRGGVWPGAEDPGRCAELGGVGPGAGAAARAPGAPSRQREGGLAPGRRTPLGRTPRPRGHEPGAAAEARPAVPGPGGRPDPGSAGPGARGSGGKPAPSAGPQGRLSSRSWLRLIRPGLGLRPGVKPPKGGVKPTPPPPQHSVQLGG